MASARRHAALATPAGWRVPRWRRARRAASGGFALVTVVWGLGFLAVLAAAIMVGTRYRARGTATAVSLQGAAVASESAVALGILRSVGGDPTFWLDPRFGCRLPDGTAVRVVVEAEAGKVDLNSAGEDLLARFFEALAGRDLGQRVAANIVAYRKPRGEAANRPGSSHPGEADPPKGGPFLTVLELDQVADVSPSLLRQAARFLTTRSGRTDIDISYATPALRDLLHLDPPKDETTARREKPKDITILADILTPQGARLVRSALVGLGDADHPVAIHEWRRADLDGLDDDQIPATGACL